MELSRSEFDGFGVAALAVLAYVQYLRGETEAARTTAEEALRRPDAPQGPNGLVYAEALLALARVRRRPPARRRGPGPAHRRTGPRARPRRASGRPRSHTTRSGRRCSRSDEPPTPSASSNEPSCSAGRPSLASTTPTRSWRSPSARIARGRLALGASELEAAREELDAFAEVGQLGRLATEVEHQLDQARAGSDTAVELPTLAELSVLRLLATDLTQREIGDELFLSMNTVKTHTRSIYAKLGVNSREAAVREATALGLIETGDSPG